MLITLFTDASYCSRSRVAAYAAWAKADGRTVRHSGVLRQPVPNSSMAETMALVNGIHLAIAAMRPPPASKIIAQTDCLGAIQALSGMLRRAQVIRQYEAVVAAYRDKVAASGVVVEFRHVGGHRGTVTPRNAVNTWCDGECRRLMRAARSEVLGARHSSVRAAAAPAAAARAAPARAAPAPGAPARAAPATAAARTPAAPATPAQARDATTPAAHPRAAAASASNAPFPAARATARAGLAPPARAPAV